MRGLIIAIQFLTRLPMPRVRSDEASFGKSIRWFPAVGLIIGLLVSAAAWAGSQIDMWTGALAGLITWVAVTGALHLDGLADLADASGAAHKDREGLLAVLADPHVGSFGVVAIVLQMAAKLVMLHGLISASLIPMITLIPFAARLGPLVWTRWLPSLHDGLAARFRFSIRPFDIGIWSIMVAGAASLSPALIATPLLIAAWGGWVRRKIGGISGDGHGAGIELIESGLLIAMLIADRLSG